MNTMVSILDNPIGKFMDVQFQFLSISNQNRFEFGGSRTCIYIPRGQAKLCVKYSEIEQAIKELASED